MQVVGLQLLTQLSPPPLSVREMQVVGLQLLTQLSQGDEAHGVKAEGRGQRQRLGQDPEFKFGYHMPPFRSVDHLQ